MYDEDFRSGFLALSCSGWVFQSGWLRLAVIAPRMLWYQTWTGKAGERNLTVVKSIHWLGADTHNTKRLGGNAPEKAALELLLRIFRAPGIPSFGIRAGHLGTFAVSLGRSVNSLLYEYDDNNGLQLGGFLLSGCDSLSSRSCP
jgi:hypothetical protein